MEMNKLSTILDELKNHVKSGDVYYSDHKIKLKFNELIKESVTLFKDKSEKLNELKNKTINKPHGPYGSDILKACSEIEKYLSAEYQKELKNSKSFLNPAELIKHAGMALRQGQDAYAIHLCDAAIEAFLKDVFDVPSTIVGAGTVKFLSECIILNIPNGMNLYLNEVKNKVSQIDNQVKHKAYLPSRLDAINALKAVEELYIRRNRFSNLNIDEKRKVQIGIGLVKK